MILPRRADAETNAPEAAPAGRLADPGSALAMILRHRRDVVAIFCLFLLGSLVSWDLLRFDRALARVDVATQYLPWYSFLGDQVRHLDAPGWNPFQFSGTPFAGDPQSGWMYLPAMVIFAIFPAITAFKLFYAFHLIVAALLAYAYARVMGMGPLAAVVVAIAFDFERFIHFVGCCVNQIQVATWIPLALLGVEVSVRAGEWSGRAVGWCMVGVALSQIFAGWIGQGSYNTSLLIGAYLAYRHLGGPITRLGRRAANLAIDGVAMFGLGFALAAASLLPRLDVNRMSNLAGGYGDDSGSNGWSVGTLIAFLAGSDQTVRYFYFGGATLALALLAPLVARRRYGVPFFAAATMIVAILMLGTTPVHRAFYLLPGFQSLHEHAPRRAIVTIWIAPAMLAGATVQALPAWFRRRWSMLAPVIVLALAAVMGYLVRRDGLQLGRLTWTGILSVAALLAVGSALGNEVARDRWPKIARFDWLVPVLLVLAVLWDPVGRQMVDNLRHVVDDPVADRAIAINAATDDPGGAGAFLQAQASSGELFRFFGYDIPRTETGKRGAGTYHEQFDQPVVQSLLVNGRPVRLAVQDVQGYNPVQLKQYTAFLRTLNRGGQDYHEAQVLFDGVDSPLLDILNVRYIVIPIHVPAGRPRPDLLSLSASHREVFRNETIRVLQNEDALPRAWVVHEVRQEDEAKPGRLIATGKVDPRRTAVISPNVIDLHLAVPIDPTREAVTSTSSTPDEVRMDAHLEADGLVVVSEIAASGWTATVDGRQVPIYTADGLIRAVPVPAGDHRILMRYQPRSLRYGMMISAAGLLTVILLIGFVVLRAIRRRKQL